MGKGKRNRQFHYEDKQSNPEKYKEKKKPFRMPKWAMRTIWIALAAILVVSITVSAIINSGVFLRNRILVESQSGEYDLNQQMASFIVWQNFYQTCFYEYYYYSWGIYEDTEGILKSFDSAADYAVYYASAWTTGALRDGIDSLKDYLVELVAGADAGLKAGLTLTEEDEQEAVEMKEWLESVRAGSTYTVNYKYENFLKQFIATGLTQEDVDAASRLLAMYTKYCNYTKYGIDSTPTEDTLLDYIAKNPSGNYQAEYRFYKVFDVEIAKAFEKLTTAEEFKDKVFEVMFDRTYTSTAISKYVLPVVTKTHTDFQKLDGAGKIAKLEELGITSAPYKSNDTTLDSKLSTWLFNSKRAAGESTVISTDNAVYLVYAFSAPKADATNNKVSNINAGWVKYTLDDFADVLGDAAEKIKADVLNDKYTGTEKSSEILAKEFLDKLTAKTETMPSSAAQVVVKEPSDSDSSINKTVPDAVVKALYGDSKTYKKGDLLQGDDGYGVSYVISVEAVEGKNYNVKYTSFEDTAYYSLFREIDLAWEAAYAEKPTTFAHPETTEKDTFQEWLCESELKDATADTIAQRIFARKANDIKYFKTVASSGSSGTTTSSTSYTVYFVEKPMELIKTEDKTVYGGYLKFDKDAEAREVLNSLKGKKGFALWNAFNFLSYTSVDDKGKETVTDSTMNTAFKEADITNKSLKTWLFDDARKTDDMTVISADDGFYLAFYISSEKQWVRNAKDGWVASEMASILEKLVKDGGYAMSEDILNKIGQPSLELGTGDESTSGDETTTAGDTTAAN